MNALETHSPQRRQYADALRTLRVQDSILDISNRFPWHCKLAVKELLEQAIVLQKRDGHRSTHTVRLLTSTFPLHIYGELISDHFYRFLKAGGMVKVLAWCEPFEATHPLYELANAYPKNCLIHFSGTKLHGDLLNHSLIVDERSYRYEEKHREHQAEEFHDEYPEIKARICFNDPAGAKVASRFFDELWNTTNIAYRPGEKLAV